MVFSVFDCTNCCFLWGNCYWISVKNEFNIFEYKNDYNLYWMRILGRVGYRIRPWGIHRSIIAALYVVFENYNIKFFWRQKIIKFAKDFLKAIKLGYIGSVLYTVETVVGCTWVQVPLSQQKYGLFEYRLVRQLFTLERGVRLPYRLRKLQLILIYIEVGRMTSLEIVNRGNCNLNILDVRKFNLRFLWIGWNPIRKIPSI